MSEDDILAHKWADIRYNEKGIFIVTRSGNVMTALDDDGVRHFLPRDASNRMLGEALLDCLAASRLIPLEPKEDWKAFIDWREADRRWKEYEKWQLQQTKTKTLAALRKAMMACSASIYGSVLIIDQCHHVKANEWEYSKDHRDRAVRLPFASPAADIGAALREAMNRCTGLGREEAQLPEPMPD